MKKILVIEDDLPVRENILELLEAEEFDVIGAENGAVGVQMARKHLPDLILCDVMMPELDGHGVLATLRTDPATAAIPFIFLTAKADKTDFRQGMNLGADDYLTKPCTADELLGAIAARLQKQAAVTEQYTTALNQAQEQLNQLIRHDSLTGLPNRLALRERFTEILAQASQANHLVTILLIHLNRFNRINDSMGYQVGDLLIQTTAERIVACVQPIDSVIRLNPEQFIVILSHSEQNQAAAVAQLVLDRLSIPFVLEGQEIFITTSIGLTTHSDAADNVDLLIKQADAAMQTAQKQSGNHYEFYASGMTVGSLNQFLLEANLRHALERSEFQVYYQPKVSLVTGEIVGAEALIRWFSSSQGFVSPVDFIPLAEETGLIVPLDEWVMTTVCTQAKQWQLADLPPLQVAVNLSGLQFHQTDLTERVTQILQRTELEPQYLELELTESVIMQNTDATIKKLDQLKTLGIQIAIDDFGTGYSSLSYLKQFSFDTLKIDRCFVQNISCDSKNAAITTAMIQMAHDLDLKVIAEGVETNSELAFLQQQACDEMQGYFFSRPVPAPEFEQLLVTGKRLAD
ncbi:GGDEF domain-containing response regulator [Trichocoleus sp. FACHB-262]|uniref:EAL domain-containing response regulator n=1 Tax=Trichocoleus sp. FACHB-262 TaxID=2692869 RepID=UPI001684E822|nr:GGDEF domain-containing response regulator [Trichocoleus sp. FACHB-262]MBD2122559.1 EAL domain-containing protein [Trichocoleus sp. FACHB-262]